MPGELPKALGSKQDLYNICKDIYENGEWNLQSIIIQIEKKKGAQECVNFRTISLKSGHTRVEDSVEDYSKKTGRKI